MMEIFLICLFITSTIILIILDIKVLLKKDKKINIMTSLPSYHINCRCIEKRSLHNTKWPHGEVKKVFCKDCDYCGKEMHKILCIEIPCCKHPSNIKTIFTPYEMKEETILHTSEINKDNDCSLFEKKKSIEIKEEKVKKGGLNKAVPTKPRPKPTARPTARPR